MIVLAISEGDKQWLKANYPELEIEKDKDGCVTIIGTLKFDMIFYEEGKPYVIKPQPKHINSGYRIQDEYQIKIVLKSSKHSDLPQVFEIGGRLNSIANDRGFKLTDLHINPDEMACLCLNIEEESYLQNGFIIEEFFNLLVIPFFYAQSYFEKNASWPWGQYSHGSVGIFEWCYEQSNLTENATKELINRLRELTDWQMVKPYLDHKKTAKGHHECLCGSKKKFRNCHEDALHGIWKLKQNIETYSVKL